MGLLKAVEHFDPSKDARLATYAKRWIEGEMLRLLRSLHDEQLGLEGDRIGVLDEGGTLAAFVSDEQSGGEEGESGSSTPGTPPQGAPQVNLLGAFVGGARAAAIPTSNTTPRSSLQPANCWGVG